MTTTLPRTTSCSPAPSRPPPAASIRRCAPSARWAARRASSRAPKARISGTPTASATSTTSAPGARPSSATPTREVVKAVQDAAARGLSFGAPTEGEIEMAEEICRLVPSIEQVRLVSSGTEATMSALRLARGATGTRPHRQVRRLLPRPRRLAAGQGRQRPAHLRQPDLGRRAGRLRQAHPGARLQQRAATGRRLRHHGRQHRLRDRRGGGRQHEPGARHARIPAAHARTVHRARRGADLRRSDVGFPRRHRRRPGRCTASRPT